jgi:hypothetical protein
MDIFFIILALLILFDIAAYLGGADSRDPNAHSQWDWFRR